MAGDHRLDEGSASGTTSRSGLMLHTCAIASRKWFRVQDGQAGKHDQRERGGVSRSASAGRSPRSRRQPRPRRASSSRRATRRETCPARHRRRGLRRCTGAAVGHRARWRVARTELNAASSPADTVRSSDASTSVTVTATTSTLSRREDDTDHVQSPKSRPCEHRDLFHRGRGCRAARASTSHVRFHEGSPALERGT